MGVGRRPKTTAQRSIDGSKVRPRHRVVAQPEPIAGEPVKPAHLSDLAAAHWDELVDQLRKERRLHVSDGGSLRVAANLYAEAARWTHQWRNV